MEWQVVMMTHRSGCERCNRCVRGAIALATATGSTVGVESEANCGARVVRRHEKHGHAYDYDRDRDVFVCVRCASSVLDPESSAAYDSPCTRDVQVCQWFALCDNEATTTRPHPVLGAVPICDRCNAKTDELEGGER